MGFIAAGSVVLVLFAGFVIWRYYRCTEILEKAHWRIKGLHGSIATMLAGVILDGMRKRKGEIELQMKREKASAQNLGEQLQILKAEDNTEVCFVAILEDEDKIYFRDAKRHEIIFQTHNWEYVISMIQQEIARA